MVHYKTMGALIIAMILFKSPVQATEKIILSTFVSTPLVEHYGKVVGKAYKKLGYAVELLHLPGERAIRMANDGDVDGELYRNSKVSQVYTNLIMIPVPVGSVETVVFSKKKITVDGWDSLRPYTIGVEIGFKLAEENTRGMKVVRIASVDQSFRMLNRGRLDVVIQSRIEGLAMIKKLGLKGIQVVEQPLSTDYVYHHLHKRHKSLVPKLTEVLRVMEREGELGDMAGEVSDPAGDLPDVIYSCNDGEWPPYSYKNPENKVANIGISCDILQEIFMRQGLKVEILTLPWKRCLQYVQKETYHIATDASRNPERERNYLISNPVYKVQSGLFYLKSRYPAGPGIRTVDDVNTYSLGGVGGYNYDIYAFDTENIDTGADGAQKLMEKLRVGRFDMAIGYVEILKYLDSMGNIDLTGIGWLDIPGTAPFEYHYMLPRNKTGESLLRVINEGMEQLRNDGTYQNIFRKYGIGVEPYSVPGH